MKWLLGGLAATVMALLARKREAIDDPAPAQLPVVPTGPVVRPVRTEVDRPGRLWTWEELSVSDAARRLGLDNTPTAKARANLRMLCVEILDPLRERYPGIQVTSAFRTVAVNKAVGGVASSRHLTGLAADVVVPAGQRAQIVRELRARGVKVLEYTGHIHVAKVR